MLLTSASNPKVKLLRSLGERRHRRAHGMCLAEGVRLVGEALDSGLSVGPVLYDPERLSSTASGRALRHRLERLPLAEQAEQQVVAAVSDTVTSQGVVAAVSMPKPPAVGADGLVLILDAIADPGNAGTMLRTARAAGVAAVVATQATADLWSPKAVRAGMGAHFHLNVHVDVSWKEMELLIGKRPLILASAHEGAPYWTINWQRPLGLIVGSESSGASKPATAVATEHVTIPMAPGVESLNAAAAAAILLFEARRPT